jgi:hypothetical protein
MSFSGKAVRYAILAVVLSGVLSCENPFRSDLGPKVDITPPVLTLENPVPGQDVYLRGIVPFFGTASDDRGVSAVQVSLDGGASYQNVSFDAETGKWSFDFNTLSLPQGGSRQDGPITLLFRAIDNDDRVYDTNALSFYVKNTPPQLELNSPSIVPNKLTGAAGEPSPSADRGSSEGQAMNLAYAQFLAGGFSQLGTAIDSPDPLPTGEVIRGFVNANDGIHPGYPQIVFWSEDDPDPAAANPDPETWSWRVMEFDDVAIGKTLTAKAFRYTLINPDKHLYHETVTADTGETISVARLDTYTSLDYLPFGKAYRYRLRVMDAAGRMNYYPPDDNPAPGEGLGAGAEEGAIDGFFGGVGGIDWVSRPGKRYITQTITAPKEKPTIEAVPLPYDTSAYVTGSPGSMPFLPETGVPSNEYHKYVNSNISYKRDDFVFQVLAAHTGVIDPGETELKFSYSPFPGDTTHAASAGTLQFDPLTGADATGGLAVGLSRDPVTQGKVYQFTSNYPGGGFGTAAPSTGSHGAAVQPGMYEFTVHVESAGTSSERSFTIYVDKTEPGIQINVIEGAIQGPDTTVDGEPNINTYKVNGHIKVRLIAYENETLLRNVTDNGSLYTEQKFFISPDSPATLGIAHGDYQFPGEGTFTSVAPVFFESGTIVVNTRDYIPSGSDVRYLYMFDRDAAFNSGYKFIRLDINQDEDKPVIRPDEGFVAAVNVPMSSTLDGPDDLLASANAGNILGKGARIDLTLSDDDSLLLSDDSGHTNPKWNSADQTLVQIARESSSTAPYYTELKTVPIGEVRRFFNTNSAYRVPGTNPLGIRKDQSVQINLKNLNSALTGTVDESNELPDGKYYLKITVYDHEGIKYWITQPNDATPPAPDNPVPAVSSTLETWIAVDTSGPQPQINEFNPPDGSRAKNGNDVTDLNFPRGYITIAGKIADPNDVNKLEMLSPYKYKAAAPNYEETDPANDYRDITASLTAESHTPGGDYVYSFAVRADVDLGPEAADEADRIFTFRATDKFGNVEEFEHTLRVDKVAPVVSLLKNISTTPVAGAPAANGIVEFVVGLVEENPDQIRYWFLPSAGEVPLSSEAPTTADWGNAASPKGAGTVIPKNNWYDPTHSEAQLSYTWRIDTTGFADGWYQLYVMAYDAAQNFSIKDGDGFAANLPKLKLQTVYLSQAADKPQFSQVKPDGHFVGANTLRISGRVNDDDGFAAGTKVQVSFNGGPWTDVNVNNIVNQGRAIDFNTTIPTPGSQSTFTYKLKVSDDSAKKLPADSSIWTPSPPTGYNPMPSASYAAAETEKEYAYTYDTEPPALYFDTALQFDKAFRELPDYIYVGVVENRLNPLVISAQNPTAGLSYNFENSGAASSPILPAGIATHITKVAWTAAEAVADTSGQTIYAGGTEVAAGSSPSNIKNAYPDAAVYRVPKALLEAQKPWAPLGNGSLNIQFTAVDEAGNNSRPTFSFYKDTAAPAIDFTGIVNTSGYTSLTTEPISVLGFTGNPTLVWPVLEGKFDDVYTPLRNETYVNQADVPAITYHLYHVRTGANIASPTFDPADDAGRFIEFTPTNGVRVPLGGLSFGNWGSTENGKSIPWAIELKTGDVAANGSERPGKWKESLTPDSAIPDGLYLITIAVQDLNGNATTYKKIFFRTDHAAPETEVTSPAQENAIYTASAYDPFTISGTAADPNLKGLSIRIGSGGASHDLTAAGGGVTTTGITEVEAGPGSGVYTKKVDWTYQVPDSEFSALGGGDGEYSVFITAVDENGETTEQEWRFIKDGTPVAVNPSSMDPGDTYLNTATSRITGSAFDLNRLKQLQARIEEWDYATGGSPGGEPGSWKAAPLKDWFSILPAAMDADSNGDADSFTLAAQNLNWEINFNATGTDDGDTGTVEIGEGKYRIKFRSRDWSLGTAGGVGNFREDNDAAAKIFHINPKEPKLAPSNESPFIKGSGASVTLEGSVVDSNRIKQVRAWASGGASSTAIHYWPTDGNANAFNGSSAISQNYSITLTGLDLTSSIAVKLEAEDWSGRVSEKTLNFTVDNDPPGFEVLYPQASTVKTTAPFDRLMGRDVIRGTGTDTKGLAKLEYKLGRTAVDVNNNGVYGDTADEGGTWASSDAGTLAVWQSTNYSWSLSFPNISSLVPTSGTSNEWVEKVDPSSADTVKGGGGELNPANPLDTNIWLLPVMFKVTDLAGNVTYETRHYWVDPYGDLPKVAVNSPKNDGIVGGTITVTGTASDSHGRVENVVYRVLNDSSGVPGAPIALAEPAALFPADIHSNSVSLKNPDGTTYTNPGQWRLANIVGGIRNANVQWNFKINTTSQLDPATDTAGRPVFIEVMAWDSMQNADGTYVGPTLIPSGAEGSESSRRKGNGWITRIKVTVEKGVPVFQTVKVYTGAAPGTETAITSGLKGTVYVDALVTDDQGLESISYTTTGGTTSRINLDPAASPAPATAAGNWGDSWAYKTHGPSDGGNPYPGLHTYKVHVPLNLDGLANPPDGSSIFNFEFVAMDLSVPAHHPRTATVPLQVDRFAPLGEYTGNSNAIGSNYLLQGRIWDREGSGVQVGGNNRVEIWVKNGAGKFYRATASGGNPVEISAGSSVPAYIGRHVSGSAIVEDVYASVLALSPDSEGRRAVPRPATFITVDRNGTYTVGGDAYTVGWYPDGIYHEWTAEIDTANLPAGVLTACFLVYDDAGNATYYEHPLIIRDGGPGILGVSLATDLYDNNSPALNLPPSGGNPAVINQEKAISVNYEAITGFTARSELIYLRAMVNRNSGAAFNPYAYKLSYIGGEGASVPITGLIKGTYYKIDDADSGGFSSWESVGLPIGVEAETGAIFKATGGASRGAGTAKPLTLTHVLNSPALAAEDFTDPETGAVTAGLTSAAFTYNASHFTGANPIVPSQTVDNNSDSIPDLDANGQEILTGHPRFVLEVTDNKEISSFIVLAIPVINNDFSRPQLVLYDLNPKHETGREAAAAPGSLNAANPQLGTLALNKNRGGLYNTTGSTVNVRKSGHIEPRKNTNVSHGGVLPGGTLGTNNFEYDTLSGEVILRGWAKDSRRIQKISLDFAGKTGDPALASIDILQWDPAKKKLAATAAATRGSGGSAVALAYTSEVMDLTGHYVEWAFIWDTQTYPKTTSGGTPVVVFDQLKVSAKAWDLNATAGHDSVVTLKASNDAGTGAYNAILVNLAPYVTGIDRKFSTITNLRSKLGYYSLNRGEEATLNGFNLSKSATPGHITLTIGGVTVANRTPALKTILFEVPGGAVNGEIKLVSQSANAAAINITAVNSDSRVYADGSGRRTNPWNRENTQDWNANTWTDKRMARIWSSGEYDGFGGGDEGENLGGSGRNGSNNAVAGGTYVRMSSKYATDVAMTVNPTTGKLYGAWGWEDRAWALWGTEVSDTGIGKVMQQWTDPFDNFDIHYTSSSTDSDASRGYPNGKPIVVFNSGGTSGGDNPYDIERKGGLYVFDYSATEMTLFYNNEGIRTVYMVQKTHQDPTVNSEGSYTDIFKADRFRNPRIITNGWHMHVSYYDQVTRSLKYWYGREGANATNTVYRRNQMTDQSPFYAQRWLNLDGGWEDHDTLSTNNPNNTASYANTGRVRKYTSRGADKVPVYDNTRYTDYATTQRAAGLWSAIAYYDGATDGGKPVIVYYAQDDKKLLYTYSSRAMVVDAGYWSDPAPVLTSGGSDNYGEYVSARIDNSGYIHIAYFDRANSALMYVRSTNTAPPYSFSAPVQVDKTGAVGRWTDLSLDANQKPWIVYEDIDRQGTADGIKVAYIPGAAAYTDAANWETMNVPARNKAAADTRLNIENIPTAALEATLHWHAAVGYQSANNDYFRTARLVSE